MDQRLKQRLVGLTVIFSLAVIFLPMLLDGAGTDIHPLDSDISDPPELTLGVHLDDKMARLQAQSSLVPDLEALNFDQYSQIDNKENDQKEVTETKKEQHKTESTSQSEKVAGRNKSKSSALQSQPLSVAKVTKDTGLSSAKGTSNKSATKSSKKKISVAKPEQIKKPGGNSWVVQAGSYLDQQKAFKQQDKLQTSKIASVFIEQFEYKNHTNFRVRLGPFVTQAKARVAKNKLVAKYNIKGLIMKFEK